MSIPEISRGSIMPLAAAPISDAAISRSWYIFGDTSRNVSINIQSVWEDYRGTGVKVAVLDSGIDFTHGELAANYAQALDHDLVFDTADYDPARHAPLDAHGTQVAGVIGADDNGLLSVGVAPDVTLVGLAIDYDSGDSTAHLLAGLQRAAASDVVNGSWSFVGSFADNHRTDTAMADALRVPVETGRGGLGTVVVLAAGNEHSTDSSNYHNFQNSPLAIAVAAVDKFGGPSSFSSAGFNVLVSAPGTAVFTTTLNNGSGNASGTSFSAPVVSGIAALILEANADLGYRDVQQILAHSAREITSSRLTTPNAYTGWLTTAAGNQNGGGLHYSADYGFGYVNAHDAVRLAETWIGQRTLANRETLSVVTTPVDQTLIASEVDHLSVTIDVTSDLSIEQVQVVLGFDYRNAHDLDIYLTSPLGFTSQLAFDLSVDTEGLSLDNFALTSVAHLGESALGQWTLDIFNRDAFATDFLGNSLQADLTRVELDFFGSLPTTDDVYIYTDELATLYSATELETRLVLADSDGGTDTLNAAAVTSNVVLSLVVGSSSSIAGMSVALTSGVIENAFAGDGNDRLIGNDADNILSGGRGADSFAASAGADSLEGGTGTDTLIFDLSAHEVSAQIVDAARAVITFLGGAVTTVTGIESFVFADFSTDFAGLANLPRAPVGTEPAAAGPVQPETTQTFAGTARADRLTGTAGNDLLQGNGGADRLVGGLGDDLLQGGDDNDQLSGNDGADWLEGGAGNDNLIGSAGDDWLDGGAGRDQLTGGAGQDVLTGGAGIDKLTSGGDGDRFVFTLDGVTDADQVLGFSVAGGDIIDLSQLSADLAGSDLRLTTKGAFTTLFVTLDDTTHDVARFRGSDIGGFSVQALIDADQLLLA